MNIKQRVIEKFDECIDIISTLVSFPTIQTEALENQPFGVENARCLEKALEITSSMGFKSVNLDNYCGYAEMGEGEEIVGILGHLDVVPVTEGWKTPPFQATIIDDMMYGRGVADDKGPLVAGLMAMQIVKELNIPLKKRVRLIMGCNEESGFECIKHYVEKEGHIDIGFTPDGSFPIVHGEKGMIAGKMTSISTSIVHIHGGIASNVVCGHVEIQVKKNTFSMKLLDNYFKNNNILYSITETDNDIVLKVEGTSAHASTPELGKNAISYGLVGLKQAGFQDLFVDFYCERFGLTTDGELLGCKCNDEFGALTCNIGVISMTDGMIEASIDIRYPVSFAMKKVVDMITPHCKHYGGIIEITSTKKSLFYPLDSPIVTKLMAAYQEVTNDTISKPMTMGGGTYAKGINNCVAFGGMKEGFDYHIHDNNECIPLVELKEMIEIYTVALLKCLED